MHMAPGSRQERCDVIVVGGGSAAFEVAVAARQGGAARVVMLEKAPETEFGGNARFSHTGFRWAYAGPDEVREFIPDVDEARFRRMHLPGYSREDFLHDLTRVTRGRINPELAAVLVDQSSAAMHWMRETGIQWEPEHGVEVDGRTYFEPGMVIHPRGGIEGGLGQLLQWRGIALGLGVDLRYEARVSKLHGNVRRVEGVEVTDALGSYDLLAPAVILCAGGFQASAEMRARYLGPNADLMKVRGSKHDTGEVLQMALALGAKSAGHWQGAHATPIDATFPDVELSNRANRYGYPYGITVNSLGQRFFDEGESHAAYTYAKTGWVVLSQPGAVAYQLYDRTSARLLNQAYYAYAEPAEADTIADLARLIGIEPAVLVHTVDEFNRAVSDDAAFDPTQPDGKRTEGITPQKSNWAIRLQEPPFRAYAVTGGVTFTFGGLAVNTSAQVLDTGDEPIRGLFASGDIIGLFYHNYPSCTGQTRNAVFSRLAGQHAAQGD
jgi:tricarballylate dehydrogenase